MALRHAAQGGAGWPAAQARTSGGGARWPWLPRLCGQMVSFHCCPTSQPSPPHPSPPHLNPPLGPQAPILCNLTEQQLFQLAGCMSTRAFSAGQRVFAKGDPGDTFYVVEEGLFRWGQPGWANGPPPAMDARFNEGGMCKAGPCQALARGCASCGLAAAYGPSGTTCTCCALLAPHLQPQAPPVQHHR